MADKKWIDYARLLAEVPSTICVVYKLPKELDYRGFWVFGPGFTTNKEFEANSVGWQACQIKHQLSLTFVQLRCYSVLYLDVILMVKCL